MTTDKKAKSVERVLPVKADCVGLAKLATDSRKGIWKIGDFLQKLVPQTGIHWKHLDGEKASEAKAFEAVSLYVGIAPTTLKSYRNTAIAFKSVDRDMDINFSIYNAFIKFQTRSEPFEIVLSGIASITLLFIL